MLLDEHSQTCSAHSSDVVVARHHRKATLRCIGVVPQASDLSDLLRAPELVTAPMYGAVSGELRVRRSTARSDRSEQSNDNSALAQVTVLEHPDNARYGDESLYQSVSFHSINVTQCQSVAPHSISGNWWHPIRLVMAISGSPPFLTWGLRPPPPLPARASRALTIVTLRRGVAVRQRKQLGPPSRTSCPQAASLRELCRGVTYPPSAPVPMALPTHSFVHSIIASITEAAHACEGTKAVGVTPSHSISLHFTPSHAISRHHATFGHFGLAPPVHRHPLVILVMRPRSIWSFWSFWSLGAGTGIRDIQPFPRWVITYH
jgi:hypothetical protein